MITTMFPNAPKGQFFGTIRYENYILSRVDKIEPDTYKGVLYDFEVNTDHSYVTHAGIVHNGGNKRAGAFAIYLEPWHADIMSFLEMKLPEGKEEMRARDLFYALWVPDLFMRRVRDDQDWSLFSGDSAPGLHLVHGKEFDALYEDYERRGLAIRTIKARKIWLAAIDSQIKTGGPYVLYKDAINRHSNQANIGTIQCSNLCVAPETRILTDRGQLPIGSLEGQTVRIWNGFEWSETKVLRTSDDAELMRVELSNGAKLDCTPQHKFVMQHGGRVEAQNLKIGSKLMKSEPIPEALDSAVPFPHAYTHGFFCADGTYNVDGTPKVALYAPKHCVLPHLEIKSTTGTPTKQNTINVQLPLDLPPKFLVPMNARLQDKLSWFAGYMDGDGAAVLNGRHGGLQVCSINASFLNDVRLMLQTVGVVGKVAKCKEAAVRMMPDSARNPAPYQCQDLHRLCIGGEGVTTLHNLGFSPKRLKMPPRNELVQEDTSRYVTIKTLERMERRSPTFCVNEPKNHTVVFEGTMTSNCAEIVEFSSPEETAVCNLASLALPRFVTAGGEFDHQELARIARLAVRSLNRGIDIMGYPTPETRRSNLRHRPIGLGVQGLADAFCMLKLSFEPNDWKSLPIHDDKSRKLNSEIFETIAFATYDESCRLAERDGPYPSYFENGGCPASRGHLHHHGYSPHYSGRWDWHELHQRIGKFGLRNSLRVALMPTATTAQILGNNESFEPYTSNLYTRRVQAGEFYVVNHHLLRELIALGLYSETMRQLIMAHEGSIQCIPEIPDAIKERYKTAWEISTQRTLQLSADRQPWIDQTQSNNIFIMRPTAQVVNAMHFHGWNLGLKTGMYYLRTMADIKPIKATLLPEVLKLAKAQKEAKQAGGSAPSTPLPSLSLASLTLSPAPEPVAQREEEEEEEEEPALVCRRDNPNCEMCSG